MKYMWHQVSRMGDVNDEGRVLWMNRDNCSKVASKLKWGLVGE